MERLWFSITDEFGLWSQISTEFEARLPLRNLIWKGGITQTAQFVSQLDARVVVNETTPGPTDDATGALLHVYLVALSDAESDTRKAEVRARAKAWSARQKSTSWLVVLVTNSEPLTQGPKFLGMRTTLLDRLRSDIGRKDSDHIVHLQHTQVESWNALFLAIRDRAVQGLEARVTLLADEIRRMDANRMLPGWNYCKFFVTKERLADLYAALDLWDAALAQYDELEAVYEQLPHAQAAWFTEFGMCDDFTDLLNVHKKPYRQQLAHNTITQFDFCVYLCGQQLRLLVKMKRFGEIVERAQRFVDGLGKTMHNRVSLMFEALWTYSTCQNVVEICEGVQLDQKDGAVRVLAAAKAEFLASARRQLDVLGTMCGRLPDGYFKRSNSRVLTPNETDKRLKDSEPNLTLEPISNPVLAEALASDARFDQVYIRTCEQATQYYLDSGRRRFAQVMQGDIAQLHISRERWADAIRVLHPLIPETGNLGVMDVHLAEQLAVCERHLGHTNTCLALVQRLISSSCFLDSSAQSVYANMLVELAHKVQASQCSTVLFHVGDIVVDYDSESITVNVDVQSDVPASLDVQRMEAVLVAGDADAQQLEVVLDAHNVCLEPGSTRVALATDSVSCAGRFEVQSVHIFVGNVEFRIPVSNANARRFVRLNAHPTAPHVELRATADSLVVDIQPHEPIDSLRIWVHDAKSQLVFDAQCTVPEGYRVEDGALVVEKVAEPTSVEIGLARQPESGTTSVYAEYTVCGDPRMLLDSTDVEFAPPLVLTARKLSPHTLLVRAQCSALSPVRVHELGICDSPEPIARFLQYGESATAVCAAEGDEVAVSVRFSLLMDAVRMCVYELVARAAAHKLDAHVRYVQRVVLAHVRRTLDAVATVCESRLVCEPLPAMSERNASRLFSALTVVGAHIDLDAGAVYTRLVTLSVPSGPIVYVTVSTSQLCTVYEETPVVVRVQALCGKRLSVSMASQCMVAGAATQQVTIGGTDTLGSCELHFGIVPLAVGFVPLPEIICHEYSLDDHGVHWTRVPTQVTSSPSLCVVQNTSVPPVCSISVVR
ncbi:hypothetical protein IW147_005925 [Coemansia sp. RSA 720]|nr:hypothetical protein IW147_005925 [Coemansia sp. RSA 720]